MGFGSSFGGLAKIGEAIQPLSGGLREFTPSHLIAGTAHASDVADARMAAYYHAIAALDTELVRIVFAKDGQGRVHYLAAPAADFASVGSMTASSLAAALPGAPGHAGDGGYFAQTDDGRTAVVVLHKDKLTSYIGRPEVTERFVGRNLDVHRVPVAESTPKWEGIKEAQVRLPRLLLSGLALVMLALSIMAMIAAIVLSSQSSRRGAEIEKQLADYRQRMTLITQQAQSNIRTFDSLGELERLALFRAANGGTLKSFKHENNRTEWRYEAPLTLGAQQIAELGDVRTRQAQGVLIIEKGGHAR